MTIANIVHPFARRAVLILTALIFTIPILLIFSLDFCRAAVGAAWRVVVELYELFRDMVSGIRAAW